MTRNRISRRALMGGAAAASLLSLGAPTRRTLWAAPAPTAPVVLGRCQTYDVGDVAKVLIKSPYPAANALLTVEREGVLSRRPIALKG